MNAHSETKEDLNPHSREAEQALLGAMLFDNEIYHKVSEYLDASMFYNPVHASIFEAMSALIENGKLADAIVLKNRFSQDERLTDIGGVEYLALLLESAPFGAAAPEYAKLITEQAKLRALMKLGGEIHTQAKSPDTDDNADTQIADAEMQLYSLAENGTASKGFISFERSLISTIEMASAAYSRDGSLSGISTGYAGLDEKLGGLHKSDLIILAGRPSMGKTALAANIAYRVGQAYQHGTDGAGKRITTNGGIVGFFSLEMSHEQLSLRLLAERSEVSSHRIRKGEIREVEYERIRDCATEISKMPLHIDDTGGITIGALAARARRLKRMVGLDLIVVDYLQLLSGGKRVRSNDGRVQEVTAITVGLKALAKELDVPVLALAQLSRQVEQRDDKRPQLSDLRESGSIEQDADVVMFVYREEYYLERLRPDEDRVEEFQAWETDMESKRGKAEIIIGKQRHGPIGTVHMGFEAPLTKFTDLETV